MNVLNLPMRKVYAQEIVNGTKVREYRGWCDHWARVICKFEDPQNRYQPTGIKHFDVAHFYPYNNKWYLDVEIKRIESIRIDELFIEWYGEEYAGKIGDVVFVIELGEIISTNLTAK